MRNNDRCVVGNIKNDEELQARFKKKFDSLNLGRRVECGLYSPHLGKLIKGVVRNKTLCYVCEADFLGLDKKEKCDTYVITKCFLAEEKGAFSALMFMSECDKSGNQFADECNTSINTPSVALVLIGMTKGIVFFPVDPDYKGGRRGGDTPTNLLQKNLPLRKTLEMRPSL